MIFLTGATGFVGRRIAQALTSQGERLRCLVRRTSNVNILAGLGTELCYGDVTDYNSLEAALPGADTVIHLSAIIRQRGSATFVRVNYQGTKNVIEAAQKVGVTRIVYLSNLGAGPDPRFPFLHSKWQGEEEVKRSGLAYTIFRPSVIYGAEDQFINTLARIIKRTPLVPIPGSGKTRFQLISVDDVVACMARSLSDQRTLGQTISLGGPEHLTYEEIIDTILTVLRLRRVKLHIPLVLMRTVVWAMERLISQPPVTSAQLSMLQVHNITDKDVVERFFGFSPTPLREGISYIAK